MTYRAKLIVYGIWPTVEAYMQALEQQEQRLESMAKHAQGLLRQQKAWQFALMQQLLEEAPEDWQPDQLELQDFLERLKPV